MESLSRETARFTALEQTLKMNTSMFSLRNGHCSIMKWCVWLSFVSLINQEKSDIGSLLSVALGLINWILCSAMLRLLNGMTWQAFNEHFGSIAAKPNIECFRSYSEFKWELIMESVIEKGKIVTDKSVVWRKLIQRKIKQRKSCCSFKALQWRANTDSLSNSIENGPTDFYESCNTTSFNKALYQSSNYVFGHNEQYIPLKWGWNSPSSIWFIVACESKKLI